MHHHSRISNRFVFIKNLLKGQQPIVLYKNSAKKEKRVEIGVTVTDEKGKKKKKRIHLTIAGFILGYFLFSLDLDEGRKYFRPQRRLSYSKILWFLSFRVIVEFRVDEPSRGADYRQIEPTRVPPNQLSSFVPASSSAPLDPCELE